MHGMGDMGATTVPAFLTKLWTLVDDESTNDLIFWASNGRSFHVYDQARFAKEVLPHYFKHSNIASFIRQLNMYGFRKVMNVEQGGLKTESDDMEFVHAYFQRDQQQLLEHIKRKVPSSKGVEDVKVKTDDVTKVLSDVKVIKSKQESMTNKLDSLKRENEALWREVASMRQKHMKQQQIVNKLIQFLVTLVGNRGVSTLKRRLPLMINDGSESRPPPPKLARQYSSSSATNFNVLSPEEATPVDAVSSGLTIKEVIDSLPVAPAQATPQDQNLIPSGYDIGSHTETPAQSLYVVNTPTQNQDQTTFLTTPQPPPQAETSTAVDPGSFLNPVETSTTTANDFDVSGVTSTITLPDGFYEGLTQAQAPEMPAEIPEVQSPVATGSGPSCNALAVPTEVADKEIHLELDSLQTDIEVLKDLLSGGQYSLDPNTIMGLFVPEAPIPSTPDNNQDHCRRRQGATSTLERTDCDQQSLRRQEDKLSSLKSMHDAKSLMHLMDDSNGALSMPSLGSYSSGGVTGSELVTYNPPMDMAQLFDLEDLGGADLMTMSPDGGQAVRGDMDTPQLEIDSPLARRRKDRDPSLELTSSPTMEGVD